QQILTCLLDRECAIGFAGVQQQTPSHQSLVHTLQTLELYLPNLHVRTRLDVKGQVQNVLVRILLGHRRIDFGECVALILERGQQSGTPRHHLGGHGRRTRDELEARTCRVWDGAIDRYATEMVEGSEIERDPSERVVALRQSAQDIAELRIIECEAVDGDGD